MKSTHTKKIKGSSTLTLGVLAALFLVVGCGKPSLTTQSPAEVEAENERSEDCYVSKVCKLFDTE